MDFNFIHMLIQVDEVISQWCFHKLYSHHSVWIKKILWTRKDERTGRECEEVRVRESKKRNIKKEIKLG